MSPKAKHILISVFFFVFGLLYLVEFKPLLFGNFHPTVTERINDFGASVIFVLLLLYSRELLKSYHPKYKIVIGSVVLAYAVIWAVIFLLKYKFKGMVMH